MREETEKPSSAKRVCFMIKAKAAPSQLSSVNRKTQVVNEENNNFSSHKKKEEATVYSKSRSQSSVAVFPSLRPRDQAPPPVASAASHSASTFW
nr:hypothetical protein Iba_chr09aCG14460 [Ipomoea batatas]